MGSTERSSRTTSERGSAIVEYSLAGAILVLAFLMAYPRMDSAIDSLESDLQTRATANNGYSYPKSLIGYTDGSNSITAIHAIFDYTVPGVGSRSGSDPDSEAFRIGHPPLGFGFDNLHP